MSIADKLRKLLNIKGAIKEALFFVGQEVADKMEDWAQAIRNICNVPFENLGYTEEQARHCRYLLKMAYIVGMKRKERIDSDTGDFYDYADFLRISPYEEVSANGYFGKQMLLFAVGTMKGANINNLGNTSSNLCYIDLSFEECNFGDNPALVITNYQSLMYIKMDLSQFKDVSGFLNNRGIGQSNTIRVVKLQGLGTQEESISINWRYNIYLGKPLPRDTEITVNARQDLVDSLLTNSFDRASAGYSVFTITLSQATFNLLTEEEITAITAKGYTITTP